MDKERLFRYLDRKYCSKSEIIPNLPLGEDADAIWAEVLQKRRERGIMLPLTNVNGEAYWYILTNKMISASEVIVEELMEQEHTTEPHTNSVSTIEEIYYTGFMEGAQISVQDAMQFLQSGEEPESVEELILLNSRQAAGFAAENMYHAIDSNYLHNLAYFLTEGLDNGGGEFRSTDTIEIPSMQGEAVRLPSAAMIPEQTEQFTRFLADTGTHPLIKAAAAQAWVLAFRPFPEGNERLARLLSNVILIRAGYTFFGNTSISSVLARTSYDYFRAIANILRVENGADLTYFLEYCLVALSSAVKDMRARREQEEQDVIEAEQKLASSPLQAPGVTAERRLIDKLPNHFKHDEYVRKIEAALDELLHNGVEQFTAADMEAITGISRKQIRTLLLPYEESEQIFVVRKGRPGNLYSFKRHEKPGQDNIITNSGNESPSDGWQKEMSTTESYEESAIKDNSAIQQVIKSLQDLQDGIEGTVTGNVAGLILSYWREGIELFSSTEIMRDLGISRKSANNYIKKFNEMGLISPNCLIEKVKYYAIGPNDLGNDIPELYASFPKLVQYAQESGSNRNKVARVLMDHIRSGKITLTMSDLMKQLGMEYKQLHNALGPFFRMGLLTRMDGQRGYLINVSGKPQRQTEETAATQYSPDILEMIDKLANSPSSQKDRRIGRIIHQCLTKGKVTKEDYTAEGEQSKWNPDMRFAVQLGLLEKVSSSEYTIRTELDSTCKNLGTTQKCTLSALYDIFGDGMFSVEMVVANLDYSSSYVSGILHQFTMLKLLDCTPNEDNSYSYQLNVNPEDNPECFEDVA